MICRTWVSLPLRWFDNTAICNMKVFTKVSLWLGKGNYKTLLKSYVDIKEKQSLSYITLLWLHYNHWGFIHIINFRVTIKDNPVVQQMKWNKNWLLPSYEPTNTSSSSMTTFLSYLISQFTIGIKHPQTLNINPDI